MTKAASSPENQLHAADNVFLFEFEKRAKIQIARICARALVCAFWNMIKNSIWAPIYIHVDRWIVVLFQFSSLLVYGQPNHIMVITEFHPKNDEHERNFVFFLLWYYTILSFYQTPNNTFRDHDLSFVYHY